MKDDTFGNRPAQINLAKILTEMGDTHLTRKVGKIHTRTAEMVKRLMRCLSTERDYEFYFAVVRSVRTTQLAGLENQYKDKMPTLVYTHLRNAITAMYRNAESEQMFYRAQTTSLRTTKE